MIFSKASLKPKFRRLFLISGALITIGFIAFLMLAVLRDSLVYFYLPSDLQHTEILPTQRIRVGGIVEPHSIIHEGENVRFNVTDKKKILSVTYRGILPDLFRVGQGVVVEGYLQEPSVFRAETVLAKHDETYMPKEVADRLKENEVEKKGG